MDNARHARIASIATAVPPHILEREDVLRHAERIFARFGAEFDRLRPAYVNAGIDRRHSVCPVEWFEGVSNWADRSERFLDGAKALFHRTASEALAKAGLKASNIDVIVSVSSTGIATPSIEAHVMHEMGFRSDVLRLPVFGLGCAGGLTGLGVASEVARAQPGRNVLLVVIELCTLAFRPDEMTKSNIIATALFGDGAAALVLSTTAKGPAVEHVGQHCWPDTIDIMGWRVDDEGFSAIFSRSIPDLVLKDLRPAADAFLQRSGIARDDINAFTFHPGGTKVVKALEQAFDLKDGTLADERDILKGHGNMSAPTVLFVLEKALEKPQPGRRFLGALGPGFTASFATLVN